MFWASGDDETEGPRMNAITDCITKKRINLVSRTMSVTALAAFLGGIACLFSCSSKQDDALRFFTAFGLKGIESARIVHASSSLISSDYTNRLHYVIVRFSKAEFEGFIRENAFREETVFPVPYPGGNAINMPEWWSAPRSMKDQFSKTNANMKITVTWADGSLFLYGSD